MTILCRILIALLVAFVVYVLFIFLEAPKLYIGWYSACAYFATMDLLVLFHPPDKRKNKETPNEQ